MENDEKDQSNIYKGKIGESEITRVPTNARYQMNIFKGKVGEPNLTKIPVEVYYKTNIFEKKIRTSHLTKIPNLEEKSVPSHIGIVNNLDIAGQNSVLKLNNAKNMSFKNTKTDLIKERSDVFMVKRSDFNDDELELLSTLQINPNTLKSKWEWMNNDLITKYFRFVLSPYLFVNSRLRHDDFKALGFDSFLRKLERDGISFGKLKSSIPISRKILETLFDRDKLKTKIARVKKKLKALEESGHDLPKPKLYSEVIRFLDLKKEQIIVGDFIPSLNNILKESPRVKSFFKGIKDKQKLKYLKQRIGLAVRRWIKKNPDLPFKNLQEVKNNFKSIKKLTERGLTETELINLIKIFIYQIKNEFLSRYKGYNRELLENNNFGEYIRFLTENNINKNEVLEFMLDKTTLMEIFNIANIYEGGHRWTQAIRCLQTVGLAILKCTDYKCLKENLAQLTNLKAGQISKLIRDNIPLLKLVNSDLMIDKWLYEGTLFSYSKAKDLARDIGKEKSGLPGILKKPESEEKFNELAEIYPPTLVPLEIWCQHENHKEFTSTGNKLQQRYWGCKKCRYDLKKRTKDVISKIVFIIRDLQKQGLKNDIVLKKILSKSFINQFSMEIKREGYFHSTQILRIIQVISLALLSSIDYYSLNKKLKELTKLSDIQIWRNINEYIPLLGEIFPEINADIWLLQPYSTISRSTITQFEDHLKEQIKAVDDEKIDPPLSTEEIRLKSVQDDISMATASRLTHEILGDDYNNYFQSPIQYDRDLFINELEKILEKKYHISTDFVLKLYKLTNITPNEFVQYFYPKASGLIEALKGFVTFRRKDTLTNIKNFIEGYFTGNLFQYKEQAMEIYYEYLYSREKALIDKNIPFDFIYLERRIRNFNDDIVKTTFLDFFFSFAQKKNPIGIFYEENYTRASLLKLRGDQIRRITTSKILNYFNNELKIITSINDSPLYQLCKICKDVGARNLIVDHPKVLGRILLENHYSFAAEVPVWKSLLTEYITGHIDLLLFDGKNLIVADYKRNIREIKEGLPQLCTYAALLKSLLLEYSPTFYNINISCLGFCDELAIEFNPNVIGPKLLNFIKSENQKRRSEGLNNLQTLPTWQLKIKKDLYHELYKAIQ